MADLFASRGPDEASGLIALTIWLPGPLRGGLIRVTHDPDEPARPWGSGRC